MSKILMAAIALGLASTAFAHTAPIEYANLYVGPHAPPGAMKNLRHAAKLAAQSSKCETVTGGAYMPKNARDPQHPKAEYYITCSDPEKMIDPGAWNAYFTPSDLRHEIVKAKPKPISRDKAISLCMAATKSKLRYPDSAHFEPTTLRAGERGTTNERVIFKFTALNGAGNRVTGTATCIVDPTGRVDARIKRS